VPEDDSSDESQRGRRFRAQRLLEVAMQRRRGEDGGGAAVREPRRPLPGGDVDAIELDPDESDD